MKQLRPYTPPANEPLNYVLKTLGYTTAPRAGHLQGKKVITFKTHTLAFEGTAHETWTWLRETGQIR